MPSPLLTLPLIAALSADARARGAPGSPAEPPPVPGAYDELEWWPYEAE